MILLGKNEEPALDCEAEVMVDLMELANTYVEWYRSDTDYIVRVIDVGHANAGIVTGYANLPLVALKSAFATWSNK